VLNIENVSAGYGSNEILRGVSLQVNDGEIVALLGANGSGKTTLINAISGFLPAQGRIMLDDVDLAGRAPHRTFARGVVQVSQTRDLFGRLTVHENLQLGGMRKRAGIDADAVRKRYGWVLELFPRLAERRNQQVGTLSGGEQQMVAIGRALMGFPRILLMDEPSGGLAPQFVQEIGRILQALKQERSTVLLVEQNIGLAALTCNRFYILRAGQIVHEDQGTNLKADASELGRRYYL
jgi:branched-chain amino acid transport system ATP-binding protein